MFVKSVTIKNFRSLRDIKINLKPGLNILVGKNNAGKSNIIKAINYVFGEVWPTYLNIEQKDFHRKSSDSNPEDFFLIAAVLEGRDVNRDSLTSINSGIYIYEIPQKPNLNDTQRIIDDFNNLSADKDKRRYIHYPDLSDEINKSDWTVIFLAVPRDGKKQDRVYGLYYKLGNRYYAAPRFAGDFRDALLTTASVPSFRDPSNQLRINQFSWYGKLVQYLYDKRSEEQKAKIKEAQESHTEILNSIFEEATQEIQSNLSMAIFNNSIQFTPSASTRDDEFKQITLFIDDGLKTPYYDKGSGIQSALIIGLFSLYSKLFHKGSTLLLTEEPELYLHPQARRAIEARLINLVMEGTKIDKEGNKFFTNQVIISTHSPEFLRTANLSEVSIIRRPKSQVYSEIFQTSKSLPKSQQIMYTKSAEMVFADQVILVEGGEEYIIPPLSDLFFEQKGWLDASNISVIRVNGKNNFISYTEMLDELKIPWVILTDLDFLKNGIGDFKKIIVNTIWDQISEVREILHQHAKEIKGKDIKNVLSTDTRDWVKIYNQVGQVIQNITTQTISSEIRSEIISLWDSLADRIEKTNYSSFLSKKDNTTKFEAVISELRNLGIFIVTKGELEDCFSDFAKSLGDSKDRRAIEIASKLLECETKEEIKNWIEHYQDFEKMLSFVKGRVG